MIIKERILATESSGSILFIRLMVGGVFLSEGIQRFIFPADLGSGHLVDIGFPMPYFSAYFGGLTEIFCSLLILAGLYTRLAAVAVLIITVFSIVAIRFPLMVDQGLWRMLHVARTDWCMLLGACYLILKGGGKWSLDRKWWKW
jgi:putative oxidoreductase